MPVRSKEDILEILKDKYKLAKILEQGISTKDLADWKDKIIVYFDSIKQLLEMNFRYKYDVYESKEKHNCTKCGEFANISYYCDHKKNWFCKKHLDE